MTLDPVEIRIEVLGSPAIVAHGQRFEHPSRKVMALLVYLAMRADEHLSRGHLAGLLWADSAEEQARANLRQTLSQLRKLFQSAGRDPILVPFDKIVLQSQGITVDARTLLANLDGTPIADLAAISPFVEGLAVQAPEFETWATAQRRTIQGRIVSHLRDRAQRARASGRHAEVVEALTLALSQDILQEDLHRDLMQALAALGRSDEALQQYEVCRAILLRDLQVAPETATRTLAATIRAQRQLRAAEGKAPPLGRYPTASPAVVLTSGPGMTARRQGFAASTDALLPMRFPSCAPRRTRTPLPSSCRPAPRKPRVRPIWTPAASPFRPRWSPSCRTGRPLPLALNRWHQTGG